MYIIIMGGGRVGLALANLLIEDGYDITLIENDESLCADVAAELDALVICGSGTSSKLLEEGDKIGEFEVIHTPGHTSGGICLWDGENLISGDTIFAGGGVGRMDIGGNYDDMKNSVEKLTKLDVRNIYPGHGPIVENNGKEHIKMSYSLLL